MRYFVILSWRRCLLTSIDVSDRTSTGGNESNSTWLEDWKTKRDNDKLAELEKGLPRAETIMACLMKYPKDCNETEKDQFLWYVKLTLGCYKKLRTSGTRGDCFRALTASDLSFTLTALEYSCAPHELESKAAKNSSDSETETADSPASEKSKENKYKKRKLSVGDEKKKKIEYYMSTKKTLSEWMLGGEERNERAAAGVRDLKKEWKMAIDTAEVAEVGSKTDNVSRTAGADEKKYVGMDLGIDFDCLKCLRRSEV